MNTALHLTRNQSTINFTTVPYFKKIRFLSAIQKTGIEHPNAIPEIQVKISGTDTVFNASMHLIPRTNQFTCFDLLSSAYQMPALVNAKFNNLELSIDKETYANDFRIELELELES
jgi:hypothetical protein